MSFSDIRRLMEEANGNLNHQGRAEFARQTFPYSPETAVQAEYGDLVPTEELIDEYQKKTLR